MLRKITSLLIVCAGVLLLIACGPAYNGYNSPYYGRPVYIAPGVGLGTIIAVVISWTRNKSILWAVVHGILGWLYVIYAVLFLRKK